MKTNYLSLLLTFGLHLSMLAQCPTNTNNIYSFTYNGNSYEIVKENLSWAAAATCAVNRGGFLTEINSQTEQDSIFFHVNNASIIANNTVAPDGGGASYLWIGGNDINTEGNWIWDGDNNSTGPQFWQGTSSGSPIGGLYNNWGNEPDDFNGQDALALAFTNWPFGVSGEWNDVDVSNTLYYIIEYTGLITAINDSPTNISFTIYPNPSNNIINIDLGTNDLNNAKIQVVDLLGNIITTEQINSSKTTLNIHKYSPGIYLVKFYNNIGRKIYKVIKE